MADTTESVTTPLHCSICRKLKPPDAFGFLTRNRARGCRSYLCKACEREYHKQWRRQHGEHVAAFRWRCARCREYQRAGQVRTTERTKRGGSFNLCLRCATSANYAAALLRWLDNLEATRLPADAEPWAHRDSTTYGELYGLDAPEPRLPDGVRELRGLAVGLVASAIDTSQDHADTHAHVGPCAKCEERDEASLWLQGEDQGGVTIAACLMALGIEADHLGAMAGPSCGTCIELRTTAQAKATTAEAEWRREYMREWWRRRREREAATPMPMPMPKPREVPIPEAPRVLVSTPGGPMWLPVGVRPAHADTLQGQFTLVSSGWGRRRRGRPRQVA
jgi:hypothetical protein